MEPRKCPGFMYRTSVPLGQVNMQPSEFRTFIENMASEYHGDTYHLISKNCNHFTDDISGRLTGKRLPGWVNRLARLGTYVRRTILTFFLHFTISIFLSQNLSGSLCSCLLPDSIQVTTVKQLPEYHSGVYTLILFFRIMFEIEIAYQTFFDMICIW